jgi:hypothetical protein
MVLFGTQMVPFGTQMVPFGTQMVPFGTQMVLFGTPDRCRQDLIPKAHTREIGSAGCTRPRDELMPGPHLTRMGRTTARLRLACGLLRFGPDMG